MFFSKKKKKTLFKPIKIIPNIIKFFGKNSFNKNVKIVDTHDIMDKFRCVTLLLLLHSMNFLL